MKSALALLALGVFSSDAHTTSRKFLGLENPEARKEMCKAFITMPCDMLNNSNRQRRNAADTAADRCQWSHIDASSRKRRSPQHRRPTSYDQVYTSASAFTTANTNQPTTEPTYTTEARRSTTNGQDTTIETTAGPPVVQTTNLPATTEVQRTTSDLSSTTEAQRTTAAPTVAVQTTDLAPSFFEPKTTERLPAEPERPPRTQIPCHQDNLNRQPGILILLDETGSMQELGGRDPATNWGRGQGIVIKKFNQFIDILQNQVKSGETPDTEFTLITFNKVAKVVEYASILEMKHITTEDYNPGYSTNLYDSLGCALSEYVHIHQGPAARVFIISDGIHQPGRNVQVAWSDHEIHQMVSKLREEQDWEFNFFGAMNPEDKAHLKHEAMNLGIRWSETKKFDFSTNSIDVILKSISSSLKNGAELYEYKSVIEAKANKKCKRGRVGKFCRTTRRVAKQQLKNGEFKLDISDDSDQLMSF